MNLALPVALTLLALLPLGPQDPEKKPGDAPAPAKFGPEGLKKLEWLCGTWRLQDGDVVTEEHWRPLQGSTILGSSHSFDATKTHFFEHLRIALQRGQIAYLAMPGGKPPTAFLLQQLDDGVAVFENGKHDHPQRIRYEKTAAGVTATISQLDGSKAQSFVFAKKS